MAKGKLVVVLGTTACGKSGLGVELAQIYNGEIVSADSRQVYRGLDLGTGKVTQEEMEGIPHHMLDIVEPNEPYSVAQFQQGAYRAIDDILARGKTPFLVGGTGLYVRAVMQGYVFQQAPPNPALRAELERKTAAELYALYQSGTGGELNESERQNHQRLVRLTERVLGGGSAQGRCAPQYDVLTLGMTYPRDTLCARIDQRLLRRLEDGMVEEVAGLRAAGVTDEFLEGLGLEYRYILWYLTGKLKTREELVDELGRAIKRFAKRQMVWFKRDENVMWLNVWEDPLGQAREAAKGFLKEDLA